MAVDDYEYRFAYEEEVALTSSELACLRWLFERGALLELRRLSKRKIYTERLSERAYDLIFFGKPQEKASAELRDLSSGIRLVELCVTEFSKDRRLPRRLDLYEQFARIVRKEQLRVQKIQRRQGERYWKQVSANGKQSRHHDPLPIELGTIGTATLPDLPRLSVLDASFDSKTLELHLAHYEHQDLAETHIECSLTETKGRLFGTATVMRANRTVDSTAIVRLELVIEDDSLLQFEGEWQAHVMAENKPFCVRLDRTKLGP